jgi:hypothetical protein
VNPESISTQAALAVMITHLLEWTKKSELVPWLRVDTTKLAHRISILMAFLSAVGITSTMTGSVHLGGTLTITWPPLSDVIKMVVTFASSYGYQRLYYQTAVKPTPAPVYYTRDRH